MTGFAWQSQCRRAADDSQAAISSWSAQSTPRTPAGCWAGRRPATWVSSRDSAGSDTGMKSKSLVRWLSLPEWGGVCAPIVSLSSDAGTFLPFWLLCGRPPISLLLWFLARVSGTSQTFCQTICLLPARSIPIGAVLLAQPESTDQGFAAVSADIPALREAKYSRQSCKTLLIW